MAQEFVRINRGIKDIKNHKKIYSNEGDLFSDGEDIYTLVKNEFIRLTFYNDYLQEIENLKQEIENSGGGGSDCNCDELLNELNLEIKKIKKECQESIDFIDEKVLSLDEALQTLKDKQIKNEEDLSDLIEKIEDINNDIEDIKDIINELEKNNDMLNEFDLSLKEINKKIDFIKDDIETLDEFIEDIKKDLADLNDKYLTLDDNYSSLNNDFLILDFKHTKLETRIKDLEVKCNKESLYKELIYLKPLKPFTIQDDLLSDCISVVTDNYIAFYNKKNLFIFDIKSSNLLTKFSPSSNSSILNVLIDDINNIIITINLNTESGALYLNSFNLTYKEDEDLNFRYFMDHQENISLNHLDKDSKEIIKNSLFFYTFYNNNIYNFAFSGGLVVSYVNNPIFIDKINYKKIDNNTLAFKNNFNCYYFGESFNIIRDKNGDINILLYNRHSDTIDLNTVMNNEMLSQITGDEVNGIYTVDIHRSKKIMAIGYLSNNELKVSVLKSSKDIINDSYKINESDYSVVYTINGEIANAYSYCFINNTFMYYDTKNHDKVNRYYMKFISVSDLVDGGNNWNDQYYEKNKNNGTIIAERSNNYLHFLHFTNENKKIELNIYEPQHIKEVI